ncbi:hypothetical protein GVN16_19020 [Emticicia sp. CRIBPO]|uniref:HEAT repeat domain-containing protein n=1 Tax=Emticicia sp. CRIBPO TaxID=2683258 RepID=UPI0014128E08|nr:HEAT repeat domain-containing protein [Emticicia sp. CRIBPO]NBA87869.1 hypothetical protein [Emticicia sp. CRIBPO]
MEQLFSDYLENPSDPKIRKTLDDKQDLKEEFEGLKNLYQNISKPAETDTDVLMDEAVLNMIELEKQSVISDHNLKALNEAFSGKENQPEETNIKKDSTAFSLSWPEPKVFRYAAGILLVGGIFWLGRMTASNGISDLKEFTALKRDVQETKQLVMLEMMNRESASERIQAVNYSFDIDNPDKEVLESLINTLNSDSNTNVRTAAAEALSHFGNKKVARDALIQALGSQKDPALQIVIIDILANLGEKRAVKSINKLLQNSDTEDFVKRKAKESMDILNTI